MTVDDHEGPIPVAADFADPCAVPDTAVPDMTTTSPTECLTPTAPSPGRKEVVTSLSHTLVGQQP